MADGQEQQQYSPDEFAAQIKAKYPVYKDWPTDHLVNEVTTKHPEYKSWVKSAAPSADQLAANKARNAQPTQFEKENAPTFWGEAARTAAKIPFKAVGLDTNSQSPVSDFLKQNAKYAMDAANPARLGPPKVLSDVKNQMDDLSREGKAISATGRSVESAQPTETGAMQARPGGPVFKSGQELAHPFLASALRHAASNLPIIGPGAVHSGHAIATAETPQETGEGVAEAGGVLGQAALTTEAGNRFTEKAVSSIAKPVIEGGKVAADFGSKALKAAAEPYTIGLRGEEMVKKGLNVHAKRTGYDAAMKQATDEILKYHNETPIGSVRDLHEALPEIQNQIANREMNPAGARHATENLPAERLERVKAAAKESLSPFARKVGRQIPAEVDDFLKDLDKAHTLEDLIGKNAGDRGGALGEVNAKLDTYFNKYPSARRADLMKNPETAGWEAIRRSLREEVMGHLEDQGETGVRDARKTWGALEELKKSTENQINVNDRRKPMSLSRILGLVGAVPTGGLSVAAGEVAHHLNKPDVLVRRGIERMSKQAMTAAKNALPAP